MCESETKPECLWTCGRGRTRLWCQVRCRSAQTFDIEVLRNGRLYGTYRFVEQVTAVLFASRLRDTFEANGWSEAASV